MMRFSLDSSGMFQPSLNHLNPSFDELLDNFDFLLSSKWQQILKLKTLWMKLKAMDCNLALYMRDSCREWID